MCFGNQGFDTSREHLKQCLEKTNIWGSLQERGGLNLEIEENGNNLSGGERQRITLARALVKKPRLLLLDEATSAVDSQSEKIIIDHLGTMKNTTIVIVSHKLAPFEPILTHYCHL